MNILSKFSENLSDLIFDNRLTVKKLSEQIKIDCSVIHKYLRKELLPSLPNLLSICDFFSCSVDSILGLSEENSKQAYKTATPFYIRFQNMLTERNYTRYRFLKESKEREFRFARQSVDDWYHGKRLPTVDNAIALAKFFGCTLNYLLGRET